MAEFGGTLVNDQTAYVTGLTPGGGNVTDNTGNLLVVNVSDPTNMTITTPDIPGTNQPHRRGRLRQRGAGDRRCAGRSRASTTRADGGLRQPRPDAAGYHQPEQPDDPRPDLRHPRAVPAQRAGAEDRRGLARQRRLRRSATPTPTATRRCWWSTRAIPTT